MLDRYNRSSGISAPAVSRKNSIPVLPFPQTRLSVLDAELCPGLVVVVVVVLCRAIADPRWVALGQAAGALAAVLECRSVIRYRRIRLV